MTWVRCYPDLANWPAAGPPRLHITSQLDGDVVVELAWDPQALLAPAVYPDPLRYYCSATDVNCVTTDDDGTPRSIVVPAQAISIAGGSCTWSVPTDLWAGYLQETLKTHRVPATTTFSANLYYRVRVTPTGGTAASLWPSDDVLAAADAAVAPHLAILSLTSQAATPVPDTAALAGVGGVPTAPTMFSDAISYCWNNLAQVDMDRLALAGIFAHAAFKAADLPGRSELLKLWLFAGPDVRSRVTELLDRSTIGGSPLATSTARGDTSTLVQNLLALIDIVPDPDLVGVVAIEQLIDDVATEILDPNGQPNLGSGGNITPSPLQNLLIEMSPAEYARLQVGLLAAAGTAALAGGPVIAVPAGCFAAGRVATTGGGSSFQVRTNAELAFQAAMLAHGLDTAYPASTGDATADSSAFQEAVSHGLNTSTVAAILGDLFGSGFSLHQASWPPVPDDAIWLGAQSALCDAFLTEIQAKKGQILLNVFWGQAPTADTDVTHPLLAAHLDGSRVFFIDTGYAGSTPPANALTTGTADLPPRMYEDPGHAMESMAAADLVGWILGYICPDTALVPS